MIKGLKGIKNIEWILLVLAAGVLLFVLTQPTDAATSSASTQEEKLAQILSQIEGAGQVEVFLTYDGQSVESVYAFSTQSTLKTDVTGVIIVATGADDPDVKLRLMQAAKTSLGVDATRISVFKKQEEGK